MNNAFIINLGLLKGLWRGRQEKALIAAEQAWQEKQNLLSPLGGIHRN